MLGKIRSNVFGAIPVLGSAAIVILSGVVLTGCLAPAASTVRGSSSTSTSTTSTSTTASINADVYLKIDWTWEDGSVPYTTVADCEVPTGSAPTTLPCPLSMPEAMLQFGKLRFTWGSSSPTTCKIVKFQPNYFIGSLGAGFIPYWGADTSSIDCSVSPTPATCFMGAARYLVPSFPTNRWLYIIMAQAQEAVSTLDSAHTQGLVSNRLTVDNYATPAVGIVPSATDGYIANSLVNWEVTCRDDYFEVIHTINLTVSDIDGPIDHWQDWP